MNPERIGTNARYLSAAPKQISQGIGIKNVLMHQLVTVDKTAAIFCHKNQLVTTTFKLDGEGRIRRPLAITKRMPSWCT